MLNAEFDEKMCNSETFLYTFKHLFGKIKTKVARISSGVEEVIEHRSIHCNPLNKCRD